MKDNVNDLYEKWGKSLLKRYRCDLPIFKIFVSKYLERKELYMGEKERRKEAGKEKVGVG